MVSILEYIILGLVQGIFEWLPVSSEGNLVFISITFLDLTSETALTLAIWLHFGTLLAVLVKYSSEWKLFTKLETEDNEKIRSLVIYSTIGTAIVAVPIRFFVLKSVDLEKYDLLFAIAIGVFLIFIGLLIRFSKSQEGNKGLSELTKRQQLILGMLQGLSIVPGISRSGITVSTLLLMKIKPDSAFKGSFLISVPAVMGAVSLEFLLAFVDKTDVLAEISIFGVVLAVLVAFIISYFTIELLIKFARDYNFSIIAVLLGLLIIIISIIIL